MKWCVYVTIYKGDKMPPFYIGKTSLDRISEGYNGSVSSKKFSRLWKEERLNFPELFRTKVIKTFDLEEDALSYEAAFQEHFNAHKSPLFINMAIGRKKFYCSDYEYLKGRKFSAEAKEKMSLAARSKAKDTYETRKRKSEGQRGRKHSEEVIQKRIEKLRGQVRTEEQRRRISEAQNNETSKLKQSLKRKIFWAKKRGDDITELSKQYDAI